VPYAFSLSVVESYTFRRGVDLFESEFLTGTPASRASYRELMARVTELTSACLPAEPYNGKNPAALAALIEPSFLPEAGATSDAAFAELGEIISNSVSVSHPNTAAHLHCPPLLPALAAEAVISALNQSLDSFDQAPMATVLEQKFLRWLASESGLPASAGGTFTAGGTQSNYMGLLLARDAFLKSRFQWSAQKRGLPAEAARMRILCSEVAHFTVEKSAAQLGLGTDAVLRVPVDEAFQMRPEGLSAALDEMRDQDLLPFAIVATAGTTDFGSVDPLPEIAAAARSAGAWLHVDAAYGGALLFSLLHRNKLQGIELCDSTSIDFHKLFWQPIPASAFLLRDARHFELIELHADYLNPETHEEQGIPNLVTSSLLTTRRFDVLKPWFSFQLLGRCKLGTMIDRTIELASCAADAVRRSSSLHIVHGASLTTVVFRYVPAREGIDHDGLNATLRQRLFDRGIAVIGHTRVGGRQCLKLTCMNPAVTDAQMEDLVSIIAESGRELEQAWRWA
jgi:L-2,4-diaminobutyrate decarboxylase